jgi:4-hydroxy-3-polyprenylbenzoate decarboxylase
MHSNQQENSMKRNRLIVGITGATGIAYGVCALNLLRAMDIETHLVMSRAGELTREHETDLSRQQLHALADVVYPIADVGAAISSGSFDTLGLLVAPCSVRTLAEIASGVTTTLLTRAADVVLKERRKLVLMVRETPLHLGHLRNMVAVTEFGGVIMPPVPAMYTRPHSIDDLVEHTVGRALDAFGLCAPNLPRWGEELAMNSHKHQPESELQ